MSPGHFSTDSELANAIEREIPDKSPAPTSVIYLIKRTYQRYNLRHNFRGRAQSSVMMHPVSMTQVSSMAETQTSQHGLHYRTKNNEKSKDPTITVSEGNSLSDDITLV
ncbi:uncharacterized protein CEXT_47531 [Caerostris extrusa]|uniref:Uncharacterized protein n=1 Tax=Caerostris extrusa TaxID=172846 RepID=A0AAV4TXX9_CAEEX|nr:uncharacterized protein CEXT_47531 [Caerostris extrusa]